jgi:predicted RNA binding protein YcfA (HicA-like mRNA interferase family)
MSQWPAAKAKRVLAALLLLGWQVKRQTGSHKTLRVKAGPTSCSPFTTARRSGRACVAVQQMAREEMRVVPARRAAGLAGLEVGLHPATVRVS